jgi:hypothetical protein
MVDTAIQAFAGLVGFVALGIAPSGGSIDLLLVGAAAEELTKLVGLVASGMAPAGSATARHAFLPALISLHACICAAIRSATLLPSCLYTF